MQMIEQSVNYINKDLYPKTTFLVNNKTGSNSIDRYIKKE